ncbi:MAG: leucine-rich repeat domain-containing protein [Saccharofermentans sp.]|nr:leucine-rich repeat domain-containing protein [Saccharofermentans sp.]
MISFKKIMGLVLSSALVVSAMSVNVFAASVVDSGVTDVYDWEFLSDCTLNIAVKESYSLDLEDIPAEFMIAAATVNIDISGCDYSGKDLAVWGYYETNGEEKVSNINTLNIIGNDTGDGNVRLRIYDFPTMENLNLPDNYTFSEYHFNDVGLRFLEVPDTVTCLSVNNCRNLFDLEAEGDLECLMLDDVGISNILIPESYGYVCLSGESFEIAEIEEGRTSLNSNMFEGCTNLWTIDIPASVTEIEYAAFRGCSGLENVNIPGNLVSIGASAFQGTAIEEISIPEGVDMIEPSTFEECSSLEVVSIPDSVTAIGDAAFRGCSGLENVNIPDNLVSIGAGAFQGTAISIFSIPEGIDTIEPSAFAECPNLEAVTIPASVTEIEYAAFRGCSGLENVNIPDNLVSIGASAFQGTAIEEIPIPEGIDTIAPLTFAECADLSGVFLPASLTDVYDSAFEECDKLEVINFAGSEWQFKQIALLDDNGDEIGKFADTLGNNITVNFGAEDPTPAKVQKCTLNLIDLIGINFKVLLPAEILDDADAYVTINGDKYPIPSETDSQGRYTFTYNVVAAAMRDDVVLSVYTGTGAKYPLLDKDNQLVTDTGFVYSAEQYVADAQASGSADANLLKMMTRMLDYGKFAQINFNYNPGEGEFSPTGEADTAAVKLSDLALFAPVITSVDGAGITRTGSTLSLDEATTLSHNFTITSGSVDDYHFFVDGTEVTVNSTGDYTLEQVAPGKYKLYIKSIAAAELQKVHKVVVKDSQDNVVINVKNYSALSYVYTVLEKIGNSTSEANVKLVNLMKSLYLYNRAAMAYWGIEDDVIDLEEDEVPVVPLDEAGEAAVAEEPAEAADEEAAVAEEPAVEAVETETAEDEAEVSEEPSETVEEAAETAPEVTGEEAVSEEIEEDAA